MSSSSKRADVEENNLEFQVSKVESNKYDNSSERSEDQDYVSSEDQVSDNVAEEMLHNSKHEIDSDKSCFNPHCDDEEAGEPSLHCYESPVKEPMSSESSQT